MCVCVCAINRQIERGIKRKKCTSPFSVREEITSRNSPNLHLEHGLAISSLGRLCHSLSVSLVLSFSLTIPISYFLFSLCFCISLYLFLCVFLCLCVCVRNKYRIHIKKHTKIAALPTPHISCDDLPLPPPAAAAAARQALRGAAGGRCSRRTLKPRRRWRRRVDRPLLRCHPGGGHLLWAYHAASRRMRRDKEAGRKRAAARALNNRGKCAE